MKRSVKKTLSRLIKITLVFLAMVSVLSIAVKFYVQPKIPKENVPSDIPREVEEQDEDGYLAPLKTINLNESQDNEEDEKLRKAFIGHLQEEERALILESGSEAIARNFSTKCYEVLTLQEIVKKYPKLKESWKMKAGMAQELMGADFKGLLSKLASVKEKTLSRRRQKQVETLDCIIRETEFLRDVSLAKYYVVPKTEPTQSITPGKKFLDFFKSNILSYGVRFDECGWYDGINLTGSPMTGADWELVKNHIRRVEDGRWKGAYYLSEQKYVILPGLKCFSEDEMKMTLFQKIWGETEQGTTREADKNMLNFLLTQAVDHGDDATIKALMADGADINAKDDRYGITLLMWEAQTGDIKAVNVLLSNGADVNAKAEDGTTALMWAAQGGYTEIVEALLAKGSDINVKTKNSVTALMVATAQGHTKIAILLKQAGAKE